MRKLLLVLLALFLISTASGNLLEELQPLYWNSSFLSLPNVQGPGRMSLTQLANGAAS